MGFLNPGRSRDPSQNRTLPAVVVDADGLKLLARIPDWHKLLPGPAVLTPHPGEMAVLTGLSTTEIQDDREAAAVRIRPTVGAHRRSEGRLYRNRLARRPRDLDSRRLGRLGAGGYRGRPGWNYRRVAGTRSRRALSSAIAGASIHAEAGLHAGRRLGTIASVLAGDVLDSIAEVMASLPGN